MKVVKMVDITSKCDIEKLADPLTCLHENAPSDLPRRGGGFPSALKVAHTLPESLVSPSQRHRSGESFAQANTIQSKRQNPASARIVELHSSGRLSPDPEREADRSARTDQSTSSPSGYLARVFTSPDSVPSLKPQKPSVATKAPYPLCDGKKGEILFVTEDVAMVYALRFSITLDSIDVTWTNNFWVAMSYLHTQSYDSVVVDLATESVEEKFLLQFIEEYDIQSRGKKIFLSNDESSAILTQQLLRRGHSVLKQPNKVEDLVDALKFKKR